MKQQPPDTYQPSNIVPIPLDPYLSLKALASYSSLSVRTLRAHLSDPLHPLLCYRVGRKVLVRRSDFDRWIQGFRDVAFDKITAIVDEIVQSLKPQAKEGSQRSPSADRWATKRQPHW